MRIDEPFSFQPQSLIHTHTLSHTRSHPLTHTELKLKDRVFRLKKVIALAMEFRRLNNYHFVMAVLGGINRACVRRLKKTWSELGEDDLGRMQELEALMNYRLRGREEEREEEGAEREKEDVRTTYHFYFAHVLSGSFHAYREAYAASRPPTVPYFGLFLTDLTFLEDGNPDMTEEGLINFQKHEVILLSPFLFSLCSLFPLFPSLTSPLSFLATNDHR